MELMQLKVPPDRVVLMADAIERDIGSRPPDPNTQPLTEILTWLRYRLAKAGVTPDQQDPA